MKYLIFSIFISTSLSVRAEVSEAFKASHDYLINEKDSAVEYVSKLDKNYYNDLLDRTKQMFGLDSPNAIPTDLMIHTTSFSYNGGKEEFRTEEGTPFDDPIDVETYKTTNPDLRFSYKFYELNPSMEDLSRPAIPEYAALRRLLSNHVFAKAVCTNQTNLKIMTYGYQFAKLQNLFADQRIDLKIDEFFNNIERDVKLFQSSDQRDQWAETIKSERWEAHTMKGFLFRRYLDGGSDLMSAITECVSLLRKEILNYPTIEKNPDATQLIEQALKFKKINFKNKFSLEVNTRVLSLKSLAKIMSSSTFDKNKNYNYWNYETKDGDTLSTILMWMSEIDPKYNYRSVIKEEYDLVSSELGVRNVYVNLNSLLLPKSKLSDLYFTDVRDARDPRCNFNCTGRTTPEDMIIVRELK